MVVPMKIEVFWDMKPCQLAKSYHFPEEFPALVLRSIQALQPVWKNGYVMYCNGSW